MSKGPRMKGICRAASEHGHGSLVLLLLAFGGLAAGCNSSSNSPTEPGPSTATLRLGWSSDWGGCMRSFTYYVDAGVVGNKAPGEILQITVTPGNHLVQARGECFSGRINAFTTETVGVAAGGTVFWGYSKGGTDCQNFCR